MAGRVPLADSMLSRQLFRRLDLDFREELKQFRFRLLEFNAVEGVEVVDAEESVGHISAGNSIRLDWPQRRKV